METIKKICFENLYKIEKLTLEYTIILVKEIENNDDPVDKHEFDDQLKSLFLECITLNMYTKKEIIDISIEILKIDDMNFDRWYS